MSKRASAGPSASGDEWGSRALSRRGLLLGGTGLGIGLAAGSVAGFAGGRQTAPVTPADEEASAVAVSSRGRHQAGVARPATPQRNAFVAVASVPGELDAAAALRVLAASGEVVDACTDPARADPLLLPDGVGDLSVTIGIGPRLVSAIDPALPGAEELPLFAGDDALVPALRGGDLLVAAYSSDAAPLRGIVFAVLDAIDGSRVQWTQAGARGAGEGAVARNPLGYLDGVIVPHTEDELDEGVWIGTGPAAGGTVAVIRRLRLDIDGFHAHPVAEQDRIIGRERISGAPLSGGPADGEADLTAKTAEGEYLVPLRSHVRAAHPSFTGSPLMMRRGYGFSNGVSPGAAAGDGLLFICFQNDLDVFVRTQQRLDEGDDLMAYTTPTASASFLVVPGRTGTAPLGAGLAG